MTDTVSLESDRRLSRTPSRIDSNIVAIFLSVPVPWPQEFYKRLADRVAEGTRTHETARHE